MARHGKKIREVGICPQQHLGPSEQAEQAHPSPFHTRLPPTSKQLKKYARILTLFGIASFMGLQSIRRDEDKTKRCVLNARSFPLRIAVIFFTTVMLQARERAGWALVWNL